MTGWQQEDPWAHQQAPYPQQQYPQPQYPQQESAGQDGYGHMQYQQPQYAPAPAMQQARPMTGGLTAMESFWYVLMNIWFGAGYFAKIPVKKALADLGMAQMTGAEQFWYVLMCIAFGAGYFAKIPAKKALTERYG